MFRSENMNEREIVSELIFLHIDRHMMIDKSKLDLVKNSISEYISKGDYSGALIYINKKYLMSAFSNIFGFVPDDKKYELFIDVYTTCEFGYVENKKIINKVIKLKPHDLIETLKPKADDKGYITIYRGESTRSTELQKALSWTLDRNVAIWFAERFNFTSTGYIYTAKANIDKVFAYITERKEEEVLVRYKDVEIINKEKITVTNQG